jgi:2',3'-cyclic-nucleotide 2'-phosphodiesterase (5'-nucleotidase family)
MHSVVPDVDVVIANSGGFRSIWIPGIIQYQHFYNMFPFTNTLVSFEMTGKELLDTLSIIQSGSKAFYPTKGLKQIVGISVTGSKKLM